MIVIIKKLALFEDVLKKGFYVFHVHSDFTDGESSIQEYCDIVEKLGFKSLIITEHVNKKLKYSFNKFMDVIEEQRLNHDINILAGIETKVLADGSLDMPEWILSMIDVLAIAEHSFNGSAEDLKRALYRNFKKKDGNRIPTVWVHPGLKLLNKFNSPKYFKELINFAIVNKIYIEKNLRYKLPPNWAENIIPKGLTVIGLDAHTVAEIEIYAKILQS